MCTNVMRQFDSSAIRRIQAILSNKTLQFLKSEPTFGAGTRKAAVLVPLCNDNGTASMLFTVRSSLVSTHKNQISFPGGHLNKGECDIDAAVRETIEEIGSGIGEIHVLGRCGNLPAATGTQVTPVIGWIPEDIEGGKRLTIATDEVAEVFTVPIFCLLDPGYRNVEKLGWRGDMPVFTIPPYRIWGLTAFIAEGVLQHVISPALDNDSDYVRGCK